MKYDEQEEEEEEEDHDEMRSEYDFSKLKLVGRGIYAERYRAGVTFIVRNDQDQVNENDNDEDQGVER